MRTWQEKNSNGSGGPCGFSRACFPQPILACNILCKNKLAGDLTHGKRPPLRAAFQTHWDWSHEQASWSTEPGCFLTHAHAHTRAHITAHTGDPHREQMLLPTVPATCQAWHFLLLSSWQLCFSFLLPSLHLPPPFPAPYIYCMYKFSPDSYWANLIFLLLLLLLQTLDASKAGGKK